MQRISNYYKVGYVECWYCGQKTVVFTWKGKENWDTNKPCDPMPKTIKFTYSKSIEAAYWANTCEFCHKIQGDWYIFEENECEEWYPISFDSILELNTIIKSE